MTTQNKIDKKSRIIRVFISSTFRDMNQEREELVKYIFPQLRKICESRGVTWGEVDLRWGISDEQKAEGLVLPVCLDEIERCRPYFIGLLGERYGWIPDSIPQALIDHQPWLEKHRSESVTELEIIHGVLENPSMADHAFFYFRDKGFLESVPIKERINYNEVPVPEEIEQFGLETANRRADERKQKLQSLKEKIRQCRFPVRENYQNPKELGELVFKDLKKIIDTLYPEDTIPDALDRERAAHKAFATSRFSTTIKGMYIGRESYFATLNSHIMQTGPPLVITGVSGSGKSALLANWIQQRFERAVTEKTTDPGTTEPLPVILHFIGATADSTDWGSMLRRLIQELIQMFSLDLEIPDKPDELRTVFAVVLSMAASIGKFVVIIDALNQLDDRDGAQELVWLPRKIPGNARIILSTLEGTSLQELENRNWPVLTIEPLFASEKKVLIRAYLGYFGKTPPDSIVNRLANADQTSNPLYLRSLLDELRIYGDHFTLSYKVDYYLAAKTADELFIRILERYEQDYEHEVTGLVRNSMSLLWAARKGLSEAELLDLLGNDGSALPRAYWSPLYLAAEQGLINKSGLLGFFHMYLRKAIESRYLPDDTWKNRVHSRLADYFYLCPKGQRRIDELPWHLDAVNSWDKLKNLLTDSTFFPDAWLVNEFDIKRYWSTIEKYSKNTIADSYSDCVKNPGKYTSDYLVMCSKLFENTSHLCESYALNKHLIDNFRRTSDITNYHKSLRNQAWILYQTGFLDRSMEIHKELEESCRKHNDLYSLQKSLGNQGLILFDKGDLPDAMVLHKEKERICRETKNKESLHGSLGNQALIQKAWGNLDDAMRLHKEEELICREIGDKDALQRSLGNQALIFQARGDFKEALHLLKENEEICREIGNKDGLQSTLGNQAVLLYESQDLKSAMKLLNDQEVICRTIGNKKSLQGCLGNQALILFDEKRLEEAMNLHIEEEKLCRELGYKDGIQASLANQANIKMEQGNSEDALRLYQESEKINREIGKKESLAISLINQALIFKSRKEFAQAVPCAKEAYEIAVSYGLTQLEKKILPIYWDLCDPLLSL